MARHDSDRFLVVLPETDLDGAELVTNRIREAVATTHIEIPDACRLPPLKLATGKAQMKAFVVARKLTDDAISTSDRAERPAPRLVSVA